jgi:hypothetical protein
LLCAEGFERLPSLAAVAARHARGAPRAEKSSKSFATDPLLPDVGAHRPPPRSRAAAQPFPAPSGRVRAARSSRRTRLCGPEAARGRWRAQVLCFPQDTDLHSHPLVRDGALLLQARDRPACPQAPLGPMPGPRRASLTQGRRGGWPFLAGPGLLSACTCACRAWHGGRAHSLSGGAGRLCRARQQGRARPRCRHRTGRASAGGRAVLTSPACLSSPTHLVPRGSLCARARVSASGHVRSF